MSAVNGFLWILMLLFVPMCAGFAICRWFRLPMNPPICFLGGYLGQWALFQLFSVPMSLFKVGFIPLIWVVTMALVLLDTCGIALFMRERKLRSARRDAHRRPGWNAADVFALVILIAGYLCLAYACGRLQHVDGDDSRFVVEAVDIEHTNRLFLTDYGTGQALTDFAGPLRHDLFSPWTVYLAYIARMTATPVAIVAHSVLPQVLLLCLMCAYWAVAERFFGNSRFEKYAMVFLTLLVCAYSGRSTMTAEGYFMRRSWQGKAVVAGIVIPSMYLALTNVSDHIKEWRAYLLVYMVMLAMCFMSAMGIILGTILCGAFGLAYGIRYRSLPVALKIWGGVAICLVYVGIMMLRMV